MIGIEIKILCMLKYRTTNDKHSTLMFCICVLMVVFLSPFTFPYLFWVCYLLFVICFWFLRCAHFCSNTGTSQTYECRRISYAYVYSRFTYIYNLQKGNPIAIQFAWLLVMSVVGGEKWFEWFETNINCSVLILMC